MCKLKRNEREFLYIDISNVWLQRTCQEVVSNPPLGIHSEKSLTMLTTQTPLPTFSYVLYCTFKLNTALGLRNEIVCWFISIFVIPSLA